LKLAVFGKNGQVATELARRAPAGVRVSTLDRNAADFSDPDHVKSAVQSIDADAVINAVAYTAVDKAEEETELAATVNGASVAHLAEACATRGLPLVHISTDYVFPGTGDTPWKPGDDTGPEGFYGQSKLMGEAAIRTIGADDQAILRTSWVFSAHGNNFVKTMLRLGAEREVLTIVADQVGGPTPAADIADACFKVADQLVQGHRGGTYHFSGAPDVSWADFAREIFAQSGLTPKVTDIPSTEFKTPAKRPLNSRLDCTSFEQDFGVLRPDWRMGLRDVLADLSG
jgi:dTDP-4-dehydrorhamnose reductase